MVFEVTPCFSAPTGDVRGAAANANNCAKLLRPVRLLATEISQFLYLGDMQHRGSALRCRPIGGTDRPGDLHQHVTVTEKGVMVALQNIGFSLMCSQLERAIDADDAAGYLDGGAACLLSYTHCDQ